MRLAGPPAAKDRRGMRGLVIYAHPVPDSLNAAAHQIVVDTLTERGWEVDDCDLYAEGFSLC